MFCFHRWNKWGELIRDIGRSKYVQYRVCSKCGKAQCRVAAKGYVNLAQANESIKEQNRSTLNSSKENEA